MPDPTTPGDRSFDAEFDGLARLAYRVAYRVLGDRGEAEDVAQETLARACVRWRRVRGHAEAWVVRVATNQALDLVRRRSRRAGGGGAAADLRVVRASEGGDRSVDDRLQLVELLGSLPRRQREVLALRYLADLPEQATADALGLSVGSVKQHAHRGLANLRLAVAPESGRT